MRSITPCLALIALSGYIADAFVAPGNLLQTTTSSFPASYNIASGRMAQQSSALFANDKSAATICPLMDPPAQPEATFEAAIG